MTAPQAATYSWDRHGPFSIRSAARQCQDTDEKQSNQKESLHGVSLRQVVSSAAIIEMMGAFRNEVRMRFPAPRFSLLVLLQ
jgi:hypothetical protein